jgi:hypothetical protein
VNALIAQNNFVMACQSGNKMKFRRHHNNKGYRQIRRSKTREQIRAIARRLKLPYVVE